MSRARAKADRDATADAAVEETLGKLLEAVGDLRTAAIGAVAEAFWAAAAAEHAPDAARAARDRLSAHLERFAVLIARLRDGDAAAGLEPELMARLREETGRSAASRGAASRGGAARGDAASNEAAWDDATWDDATWDEMTAFVADGYFLHTLLKGPAGATPRDAASFATRAHELLEGAVAKTSDAARTLMTERAERRAQSVAEARKLTRRTLDDLRELTLGIQLIALNASVEAARAGAAGRGFAVIAQEIQVLSDRAQKSVEAISQGIARDL